MINNRLIAERHHRLRLRNFAASETSPAQNCVITHEPQFHQILKAPQLFKRTNTTPGHNSFSQKPVF